MKQNEELQIEYIDPGLILADDNARFGLKETRVESMMESIKSMGGVRTPLKVSNLEAPANKKLYRVNEGHYRLEAAMRLVAGDKAYRDMQVPVVIEPEPTGLDRIKHQLSENMDRENLTPMDTAVAIKRLMDAGMTRMDIRDLFKRPGGKKGMKNTAVSNSFLNIHLQFLEYPKNVQERIHDGRIPVSQAMALAKHPREKWQPILDSIEADRLEAIEADEKADAKFTAEEAKIKAAQEAHDRSQAELKAAEVKVQEANADVEAKNEEAMTAYKARHAETDKAKAAEAQKKVKATETALIEAKKAAADLAKDLKKKQEEADKAAKAIQAKADALAKQKSANKKPSGTVGAGDIKKAAAKVGSSAQGGPVPLKLQDVKDLHLAMSKCGHPKVKAIGAILVQADAGVGTVTMAIKSIALVTGDIKVSEPTAKK